MAPNNSDQAPNNGNPAATHFGRQVRKARRERGWSIHVLAAEAGLNAGTLSHIENGHYPPTERTAEIFDRVFPDRKGWFSEYYRDSQAWTPPGYRRWAEYEDAATNLRAWAPTALHGLIQSEPYARAMLETFPGVPAEVVSARLAARMERQRRVLRRDDPPAVWVLVDELALYREVGSPTIMAQQMDHLLEVASLPDVTVQVVPGVAHPATVSELIVSDSAAYVEHLVGGYVYTEPETVTPLARLITTLQAEANRASESIQMFGRMRDLWARGASPLTQGPTAEAASK